MGLLPASSSRRRGVTLPELLVVLVLLGLGSAIVLPLVRRGVPRADNIDGRLVADARRLAIGRAQPVRFRLAATGGWSVTTGSGALLSAGTVAGDYPAVDLVIDPLGGCLPVASPTRVQVIDPMTCAPPRPAPRLEPRL